MADADPPLYLLSAPPTCQSISNRSSAGINLDMLSSSHSPVPSTSRLSTPPSSPKRAPASTEHDPSGWQVVLRQPSEGKVVLFHAQLNELAVKDDNRLVGHSEVGSASQTSSGRSTRSGSSTEVGMELISTGKVKTITKLNRTEQETSPICPLCMQSLPTSTQPHTSPLAQQDTAWPTSSYFQLLSTANNTRSSYDSHRPVPAVDEPETELNASTLCDGYYAQYFQEIQLLGRGGQGAVYLAAHTLNGEKLGMYAVKKG